MNKIKAIITFTAFSLLVLGLPAIASAQYGGYDPYGRNNDRYGNNRNGGYRGGDMRSTLRNLKNRARDFQRQVDRDLDRSRYNGSQREDQMNYMAQRFSAAVNRLDNNDFNNGGYYGNRNGNSSDIQRVYAEAANIERTIGRARLSYQTQAIWSGIRNDLQALSRTYGNGRGGNNGGYNNGGVWGNTRTNRAGLPSWWPF